MIRNLLQALLCFVLCPLLVAQQASTMPGSVRLPKDTAIHLKLDQDVSSATIREGQNVRFIVTEDLVVGGVVVYPAGTAVFEKVAFVVPSKPSQSCGDGNNGWFSLDDPALRSSSGRRMKVTLLPPGSFPKKPMSPHEKLLAVVAAPLQIPAMAVLIAAPVVLLPLGIATGIHDSLHRPPPQAAATAPSPAIPAPAQAAPSTTAAPPATTTTIVTLTPAERRALPSTEPALPAPCPARTHDLEWKASEAKALTYYLVHDYTVRASLPQPAVEPAEIQEAQ